MTHFDGLAYNQTLDYRFEDYNCKQEKTVTILEFLGADYFLFPGASRLLISDVPPDNLRFPRRFGPDYFLHVRWRFVPDNFLRVLFAPDNLLRVCTCLTRRSRARGSSHHVLTQFSHLADTEGGPIVLLVY